MGNACCGCPNACYNGLLNACCGRRRNAGARRNARHPVPGLFVSAAKCTTIRQCLQPLAHILYVFESRDAQWEAITRAAGAGDTERMRWSLNNQLATQVAKLQHSAGVPTPCTGAAAVEAGMPERCRNNELLAIVVPLVVVADPHATPNGLAVGVVLPTASLYAPKKIAAANVGNADAITAALPGPSHDPTIGNPNGAFNNADVVAARFLKGARNLLAHAKERSFGPVGLHARQRANMSARLLWRVMTGFFHMCLAAVCDHFGNNGPTNAADQAAVAVIMERIMGGSKILGIAGKGKCHTAGVGLWGVGTTPAQICAVDNGGAGQECGVPLQIFSGLLIGPPSSEGPGAVCLQATTAFGRQDWNRSVVQGGPGFGELLATVNFWNTSRGFKRFLRAAIADCYQDRIKVHTHLRANRAFVTSDEAEQLLTAWAANNNAPTVWRYITKETHANSAPPVWKRYHPGVKFPATTWFKVIEDH